MADSVRINITISKELLKELKESIKKGNVSNFFEEAVEEKLRKEKQDKAWQELMSLPPMFDEIKDPVKWVRDLRDRDKKRLKQQEL